MALFDVILADVTAWYIYYIFAFIVFLVVNIKFVKYAFQINLIVRSKQLVTVQTILISLDLTVLYKTQYQCKEVYTVTQRLLGIIEGGVFLLL